MSNSSTQVPGNPQPPPYPVSHTAVFAEQKRYTKYCYCNINLSTIIYFKKAEIFF